MIDLIKEKEVKPKLKKTKLNIAVIGCLHGLLDKMYNDIEEHEKQSG